MALIFCVCDYWLRRDFFQVDRNNNKLQKLQVTNKTENVTESFNNDHKNHSADILSLPLPQTFRRLRLLVDGISTFYLLREIKEFTTLRRKICTNPAFQGLELFWLEIVPPAKDVIDYKWNRMVAQSLWEQIEIEHLMSWLSTLGGGFSALGEQFTRCAETAGKISLRQLRIGLRLGDPFLQARCKLYYSISLIQTGHLRTAKHLIRSQYEFARLHKEADGRLVKMCKGIWLRLQYEYGLRFEEKSRKQRIGAGDGVFRLTS